MDAGEGQQRADQGRRRIALTYPDRRRVIDTAGRQ